eukprot:jgi/Chlat1/8065/Chrsp73S07536
MPHYLWKKNGKIGGRKRVSETVSETHVKGVMYERRRDRYVAYIGYNGRKILLGASFVTREDAVRVRKHAEACKEKGLGLEELKRSIQEVRLRRQVTASKERISSSGKRPHQIGRRAPASGHKGVWFNKRIRRYEVRVYIASHGTGSGKLMRLGKYKILEEAVKARDRATADLNTNRGRASAKPPQVPLPQHPPQLQSASDALARAETEQRVPPVAIGYSRAYYNKLQRKWTAYYKTGPGEANRRYLGTFTSKARASGAKHSERLAVGGKSFSLSC